MAAIAANAQTGQNGRWAALKPSSQAAPTATAKGSAALPNLIHGAGLRFIRSAYGLTVHEEPRAGDCERLAFDLQPPGRHGLLGVGGGASRRSSADWARAMGAASIHGNFGPTRHRRLHSARETRQ